MNVYSHLPGPGKSTGWTVVFCQAPVSVQGSRRCDTARERRCDRIAKVSNSRDKRRVIRPQAAEGRRSRDLLWCRFTAILEARHECFRHDRVFVERTNTTYR